MVSLASIFPWLLLVFMIAVILYIVFNYILGLFYSHEEYILQSSQHESPNKQLDQQEDSTTKSRRRLIATFIIAIMIILLASTGISTYMDTISHN